MKQLHRALNEGGNHAQEEAVGLIKELHEAGAAGINALHADQFEENLYNAVKQGFTVCVKLLLKDLKDTTTVEELLKDEKRAKAFAETRKGKDPGDTPVFVAAQNNHCACA